MTLPTPTPPPDKLEQLLSAHLAATLNPQRGRALRAFKSKHAQPWHGRPAHDFEQASSPNLADPRDAHAKMIPTRALWFWAGVPSLLAACLAVAVTLHFVKPTAPLNTTITPIATDTPHLNHYENSQDINAGITVVDNTPVRVIRRQTINHTQWEDPVDHATYTVTEPVEKVGYVKIQPY